ncbi:hypothetical protein OBBRIDRAFT_855761 [Obba rivulosa]|uniref:polynucleotide adenylyltransferase n=1 Tax=Obba rivulosa TaxID=1052685 RepID=A0A8E2J3D5_9APHY|nr:hypothetical protein OBBRIDRAFT_855761 [Obba rivulosa]
MSGSRRSAEGGSAAAESTPKSKENRRARRQRERERGKHDVDAGRSAEAGPSNAGPSGAATPSTKSRSKAGHEGTTGATGKGFDEADFVAFSFSEGEEEVAGEVKEVKTPVREWDKGKGKMRESSGRKRKTDELSLDDGYASKRQRVAAASRRAPWLADVDWDGCTHVSEMLHRDVEAFVRYISPTPQEDEVRSLVVELIKRAVTRQFPDAQILPFGSYETKLYLPLGDIDLVIHSQSMAYTDKETVLRGLANTVRRAGITDNVKIIAKAKVPIVKFVTSHGRFSVDISINQGNGVAAGKMIKHFLSELPALRALVLVVKAFLSQRSMNEVFTGGLGSYSIVCLAISFLQHHPKIRRGEIDPSKNLGVLVMEFFELYGCHFNYHEVGISVRDGGTYFNKARRGWLDFREPKLLSIEDPGDPSNDISRGSYGIAKVRTTLAGAHNIMLAKAYLQAGILSARREGRHVSLRDTSSPEEASILASVMGVTQETINHRRMVQEVYDKGVLHRMLGVTPQASLLQRLSSSEQPARSRAEELESVRSAWGEADVDVASGDEGGAAHEEEESRYGIDARRQPPKKRRRMGRRSDTHTVFTTDDDDGDEEMVRVHDDGLSEEEEYELSALGGEGDGGRKDRKRSYWLSKALAMNGGSDG